MIGLCYFIINYILNKFNLINYYKNKNKSENIEKIYNNYNYTYTYNYEYEIV